MNRVLFIIGIVSAILLGGGAAVIAFVPPGTITVAGRTLAIKGGVPVPAPLTADLAPIGVLQGPPSLTADQIDQILASYNSPATGTGQVWVDRGVQWGIDPAYALAFFVQESTAGTAANWAGLKSDGSTTHNVGNIECTDTTACYGRFRDYASWDEGITDWYRLISDEYIQGRGFTTVEQVIPVYAPAFENNVAGYTNTVSALVSQWRATYGRQAIEAPPLALTGCLGTNVRAALVSSPGLQSVTIQPSEDWSFNEHWQIDEAAGVLCNVFYGGVCNQASRYSYVARTLGLAVQSQYHGSVYDSAVPAEDNLAIWSSGGRGGQDLIITNTTGSSVHIVATIDGDVLNVEGWLQ